MATSKKYAVVDGGDGGGGAGAGGGVGGGGGGYRVVECCGVKSGVAVGAGSWDAWFGPSTPAVTLWQLAEQLLPGMPTRAAAHIVLFGVVPWDDARVAEVARTRRYPSVVTRDEYAHFVALFGPQEVAAAAVQHLFRSPVGAVRPSLTPWYGSHMSRTVAEAAVLQAGVVGAFVVRASSHWHDLAITYTKVAGGRLVPEHVLVERGRAPDGSPAYLRGGGEPFPSLIALLAKYGDVYTRGVQTQLAGVSEAMAQCEVLDTATQPPLPLSLPLSRPQFARMPPPAPSILPSPLPPAPAPGPLERDNSSHHERLPPTVLPVPSPVGEQVRRLTTDPPSGDGGGKYVPPTPTHLPDRGGTVRNPVGDGATRVLRSLARYLSVAVAPLPTRAAVPTIDEQLRAANVDLCTVLSAPSAAFLAVSERDRIDARSTLAEVGRMLLAAGAALPAAEHLAAAALQAVATQGYEQLARSMLSAATCLTQEYESRKKIGRSGSGGGGGGIAPPAGGGSGFQDMCAVYVRDTLCRPPHDLYTMPQTLLDDAVALAQAVLSMVTEITDAKVRVWIKSHALNALYLLYCKQERPIADRQRLAAAHLAFMESVHATPGMDPAAASSLLTLRTRVAECEAATAASRSPAASRTPSPAAATPSPAARRSPVAPAGGASGAMGLVPSPAAAPSI